MDTIDELFSPAPKGDHVTDLAGQTIAAEHRLTSTGVQKRIERALTLGLHYPHAYAAYAAGHITRTHVDQIVRRTPIIDIARAYRKAGADGTIGELAADQAMTMLLASAEQTPLIGDTGDANAFTGIAGAITARVTITMPFTGLLPETEDAGDLPELAGKTPISPHVARALLGNADEVVRVVTHPLTGVTITSDLYRASASLRRFLGVRDMRCRWAACARDGDDIDHTLDYQYGGKTTPENLEVLCKRHHTVKHTTAKTTGERLWRVRHIEGDGLGRLEWVTSNGTVLADDPPRSPGVIFVPTDPVDVPPPFSPESHPSSP